MPLLSKLIADAGLVATLTHNVEITGLTADSRSVKPGYLFVAMPGVKEDGAKYIADAIAKGAVAVVMGEGAAVSSVPTIHVADMRSAVSKLAAAFYPAQPECCVAVTGTDGKTSTADFVRQLASMSGLDAASIGTLGLRSAHATLNDAFPANNTSPEPILLHHTLSDLAAAGVRVAAIETSSHGLDQKRSHGVRFAAGAFTNLTRDHLDYHGTVERYFAAKALLFSEVLARGAVAVLNRDDAHFTDLKTICDARGIRITSFGAHAEADYRVVKVTPHAEGLDAEVVIRGAVHTLKLPLYGAFQLMNMLAAVGLLESVILSGAKDRVESMAPDPSLALRMTALLPHLKGVPGRLEKIAIANGAPVFIDYAHTPAALENILKTLRPHTQKKLHVVFGCGGDRDAGKRPEMGAAAAKFADHVIVTDDNPRSEDPAKIRAAIMAASPNAQEIPDRDAAIRFAVQQLTQGDVLVVAGKGHETTQIIGNQTLPFNDAEHIRKAVAA